jgi:hypothetical protein
VTIRKGEAWGVAGALSDAAPVHADDASAASWLQTALDDGAPVEVGLVGGDLHRTLGAPRHDEADLRAGRGMRFPVDVGVVEYHDADGAVRQVLFLAHLIAFVDARARRWRGRTIVAMNAAFVGEDNLGPRAHPNDGRLDVTDGALTWRARRQAEARAPLGAHVPHPDLGERRVRELTVEADTPMLLRLDGREVATTSRFELRCLPDAATIVV